MTFPMTIPMRPTGPRVLSKHRIIICTVLGICYLFTTLLMSCSRISNDTIDEDDLIANSLESHWIDQGIARASMYQELNKLRYDAIDTVLRDADVALRNTSVYSVTLKPQTAPSGDPHDYLSLAK